MGGKHKKFIRAEKAKVKLKGAKLAKGLNITKTEFKVKKIVIREQLHDEQTYLEKRKYNVKEVLTRIRHHNVSFRTEALRNLKECITYDTDEVVRNIGPIVQAIASLSLDVERDMRRQSFKVFHDMLTIFNAASLEPFYNIISSHLKCAMSHLNHSIQEDSLLFLDVLLTYLPGLIMQNHSQIFTNFLDMISKLRTDAKPGRMLTINLGNKTTTIKWRSRILDRLQRVLEIIVKDWKMKSNSKSDADDSNREILIKDSSSPFVSLWGRGNFSGHPDLTDIFKKAIGTHAEETKDNGEKTKTYISCLFPLLLESWMEVRPNYSDTDAAKTQLVLSSEAALTLRIILEILDCLWQMVELWEDKLNVDSTLSNWFRNNCASEFVTQIFNKFPYQQFDQESKHEKSKKKDAKMIQRNEDAKCVRQNMTLVYLFNKFCKSEISKNKDYSNSILNYMRATVSNMKIHQEDMPSFEKALRSVLVGNGKHYMKVDDTQSKMLLRDIIVQYQKGKFPKNFSPKIVTLLCDIILSHDNLLSVYGQNEFVDWLTFLPLMLAKDHLSERVLRTLTNLGKQKNSVFLKSLAEQVEEVIENIEKIQVTECANVFEGRKLIMNLFYWIDFWSPDIRDYLIAKIDQIISNKDTSDYFKFIIKRTYF